MDVVFGRCQNYRIMEAHCKGFPIITIIISVLHPKMPDTTIYIVHLSKKSGLEYGF